MEESISIKMTKKDLTYFILRHNYTSVSGVCGIIFSLLALAYLILGGGQTLAMKMVLLFMGLLFTVAEPLQLIQRASRQIQSSQYFQNNLIYTLKEEGIEVTQGDENGTIPWDSLRKIIETKEYVFVYVTARRAFVFPKNQMDGKYDTVRAIISKYMKPSKCRWKKAK